MFKSRNDARLLTSFASIKKMCMTMGAIGVAMVVAMVVAMPVAMVLAMVVAMVVAMGVAIVVITVVVITMVAIVALANSEGVEAATVPMVITVAVMA